MNAADGAPAATIVRNPSESAVLPEHIGKYPVHEVLGVGAMGVVYRCRQPDLDRFVAVKVLAALAGADRVQRFRREAKAAAQIVHPNVVQIYDFGLDDGKPFLVMEWVNGRPLDKLIGDPVLTVEGALQVAFHVAQGLQAAHVVGVVHRDVKPSNILIDAAGRPKLADFGLAKMLDGAHALSNAGDLIGTPKYMSPEQVLLANDDVDARTDIYSLGAVLYEMLAGKAPFDGPNAMSIIRQITDEEPKPPHELNPDVPTEVSAICLKALAKERNERFPNAQAFADAIQSYVLNRWFGTPDVELLAGLPPLARLETPRWPWRLAVLMVLSGAAAGGVAAWSVFGAGGNLDSPNARRAPPVDVAATVKGIAEDLEKLPAVTDARAHRDRLKRILDELTSLRGLGARDSATALISAAASRRAGDALGALDALAGVDPAPAADFAYERVLANYQHYGLVLGNLADPLLHPEPPKGMTEDVAAVPANDPRKLLVELAAALADEKLDVARKLAEPAAAKLSSALWRSDLAMLRADALMHAAEAAFAQEIVLGKGAAREAAARERERLADAASVALRTGLQADPNHMGLLFLHANSYQQRAIWSGGGGTRTDRAELARRHQSSISAAQNKLRTAAPIRQADHSVARAVLMANIGRFDTALDALDDALSMRSGTDSLLVLQLWLGLLNPTSGEITAADADGVAKEIARQFDPPTECAPAYIRAQAAACAGKWDECRTAAQQAYKLVDRKLLPRLPMETQIWLEQSQQSSIRFLNMTLEIVGELPTPFAMRMELAKEILARANNAKIAQSENVPKNQLADIRAFTYFRMAKFCVANNDRAEGLKHLEKMFAEKAEGFTSEKCQEDPVLRYLNDDPEYAKLYAEHPPTP